MESWKRELFGVQSGPEWKVGGRRRPMEELELTKMDTLIMQVSIMTRSVTEVRESCLCLDESISMEEKEQIELESELKTTTVNLLGGHQHSITEVNLQASTQLIRDHIEGGDKENEMLEEELVILIKKLANLKESKRTKLKDIKDRYGNQLLDKEQNEQEKGIADLQHKKNVLTTSILNLKQEKNRTQKEWSSFTKEVINISELRYMIRNNCKTLQQHKASIRILETAVHSRRQVESPPIVKDTKQVTTHNLSSSPHIVQCTKFGEKTTNNSFWNIHKNNSRTVDSSVSEDCPQLINSVSCSQVQLVETSPSYLFKNPSHSTTSGEANFLSLKCQQNPDRSQQYVWNRSSVAKNGSPAQGRTNNLSNSNPSSEIFSTASTSKGMSFSSFVSQARKGPLSSHEALSISPQVYRGLEMASQKFKSVRVPLAKPKSSGVTVSRNVESPHIKFRGVIAPCLSRCTHVPPSSRGNGRPISRCASIYSQLPHQISSKRYNDPSLIGSEVTGSLSAKNVTYIDELQEFQVSTDRSEEKPATPSENDDNGPSSNTVPSIQDGRTPSILPASMEVDKYDTVKVTSAVPNLERVSGRCQSMWMKPIGTKDTLPFSESSHKSSTTSTPKPENSKNIRQTDTCIPAVSGSLSSHIFPAHPKKSEYPKMKSLEYKQRPLSPNPNSDHSMQSFNSSTIAEGGGFPFMFQSDSEANSEKRLQLNLFESSSGESSAQVSARNPGNSFFALESCVNSRTEGSTSGLFNFDLGSNGESTEHSDSSFFSTLYNSSLDTNSSSNEASGFHLF